MKRCQVEKIVEMEEARWEIKKMKGKIRKAGIWWKENGNDGKSENEKK